jgi:hypothetical protein
LEKQQIAAYVFEKALDVLFMHIFIQSFAKQNKKSFKISLLPWLPEPFLSFTWCSGLLLKSGILLLAHDSM